MNNLHDNFLNNIIIDNIIFKYNKIVSNDIDDIENVEEAVEDTELNKREVINNETNISEATTCGVCDYKKAFYNHIHHRL